MAYVPLTIPLNSLFSDWQLTVVALSVSVSLLFSVPTFGYGFSAGPVGLIAGVGPFIAALLGNLIAGPLSDWVVTWMSRRNKGVYEPECVSSLPSVQSLHF